MSNTRYITSCAGKSKFPTWAYANHVAKRMRRRWHDHIQPYRCQFGHHYHVGGGR